MRQGSHGMRAPKYFVEHSEARACARDAALGGAARIAVDSLWRVRRKGAGATAGRRASIRRGRPRYYHVGPEIRRARRYAAA